MARTICALLLLVLISDALGASILQQFNDEVSKINKLVEHLHGVCDSASARALWGASPTRRRAAELPQATESHQKTELIADESLHKFTDDSGDQEDKTSLPAVASRSLNSVEVEIIPPTRKDFAAELKRAEEIRDEAQAQVNRLREAKEIEDKIRAEIAKDMKHREEIAREEQAKAGAVGDAETIAPPKGTGPTLSSQQVLDDILYEALANTMGQVDTKDPQLKPEVGDDLDIGALIDERSSHSHK